MRLRDAAEERRGRFNPASQAVQAADERGDDRTTRGAGGRRRGPGGGRVTRAQRGDWLRRDRVR